MEFPEWVGRRQKKEHERVRELYARRKKEEKNYTKNFNIVELNHIFLALFFIHSDSWWCSFFNLPCRTQRAICVMLWINIWIKVMLNTYLACKCILFPLEAIVIVICVDGVISGIRFIEQSNDKLPQISKHQKSINFNVFIFVLIFVFVIWKNCKNNNLLDGICWLRSPLAFWVWTSSRCNGYSIVSCGTVLPFASSSVKLPTTGAVKRELWKIKTFFKKNEIKEKKLYGDITIKCQILET